MASLRTSLTKSFFAIAGTMLVSSPAQAVMLEGYAQTAEPATPISYAEPESLEPVAFVPQTPSFAPAVLVTPTATPRLYPGTPRVASMQQKAPRAGSRPADYVGTWRCVSQVVTSSVPEVTPGTRIECYIRFIRNADGVLIAHWEQNGWAPATFTPVEFSPRESKMVHSTSSKRNFGWSAQATDFMQMRSSNSISSRSTVVQSAQGMEIGQYQTVSTLTRVQ